MSARNGGSRSRMMAAGAAVLFIAGLLQAQPSPQPLRFEAATIKPAQEGPYVAEMGKSYLFNAKSASLKQLVLFAYDLQDRALSGGPAWMDKLHYDVVGKGAPPPPEDPDDPKVLRAAKQRFQAMTRTLLEERFQLRVRREEKELPVFHLVVARSGSKLKEAGGPMNVRSGMGLLSGSAVPMERLSRMLSAQVGRTVVDKTGLDQTYDFELTFAPDLPAANAARPANPPDTNRPSLFTALQEQLGLRLESSKENIPVLAVVSAEYPSEN